MKNLIVNIYKTLFFFDLAIIAAYVFPKIKTKNAALLNLWSEGTFLAVMIVFTAFFYLAVERKRLKIFNKRNILSHYGTGLISVTLPLAVTVCVLFLLKCLKFSGTNKPSHFFLWLAAIFCSAAATELLLRGYLFRLYRKYYSFPVTAAVITVLFISMNIYIFSDGFIYAANLLVFNLLMCLLAEYTRSLTAPVTAHFFYNAVSTLVLGSFAPAEGYPCLLKTVFSGNNALCGGEMKLEGSAVLLVLNTAVCVFLWYLVFKRRNRGVKRVNIR